MRRPRTPWGRRERKLTQRLRRSAPRHRKSAAVNEREQVRVLREPNDPTPGIGWWLISALCVFVLAQALLFAIGR